jgi:hypothetical protein
MPRFVRTENLISACTVALAPLFLARGARAEPGVERPPTEGHALHVSAEAGTDFPIAVALRGAVEFPYRIRASTALGLMPGPYVDAINGVLVAVKAYDDDTARFVKGALQSALVWRTHLGYRPFASLGLYADVGYGLVTLGGGATGAQIVSAATGRTVPMEATTALDFDARATLHMLDVEVGWQFLLGEQWIIRPALGGAFTLAANTSLTPNYTPRAPSAVAAFTNYGATYLHDTLTRYAQVPLISVYGGWRFF